MASLQIRDEGDVRVLELARPDVRNALDEILIGELSDAMREAGTADGIRVVLLRGAGKAFCAGADIGYMQRLADFDEAANLEDARVLSDLFTAISDCPKPVVARAHGAVIGGAVGLVAAADIVLAAEGTQFGLSEVRLGILPAVISPFVLRRLGPAACRRLFLTGERFGARRARELGLVDEVAPLEDLDALVDVTVNDLRAGGPTAQAACKKLLDDITGLSTAEATLRTPAYIAAQRATNEAKEGFAAFFGKRRATWAQRPESK